MDRHPWQVRADLLDALETHGWAGLVQTLARQIGPNQPSAECITEADNCFAGALTADQAWDCALDMAQCIREADMAPEPPEPPQPPEPPEPPDRYADVRLADVALATLLLHAHGRPKP